MTGQALLLVLVAALVHAIWNAIAKRARDQFVFIWSSSCLGAALTLPVGLARMGPEGFPPSAAPFVVATILAHSFYVYGLGRMYGSGEFSVVYPIARGLGVALVPALALFVFAERPSVLGASGIGLVVLGIVGLGLRPRALAAATRSPRVGSGTWWAIATGLSIATYSLIDKAGVARLDPVPYIAFMGTGSALLLLPVVLARKGALQREWRLNWRTILVTSSMNYTGFLLILFAFQVAKVGYVVAAREVSIVISILIGRLYFKEGALGRRLLAAAVVLAGVACVALARS